MKISPPKEGKIEGKFQFTAGKTGNEIKSAHKISVNFPLEWHSCQDDNLKKVGMAA